MCIDRNLVYDSLGDSTSKRYFTSIEKIFNTFSDSNSITFINFLIGLSFSDEKLKNFSGNFGIKKDIILDLISSVNEILENKSDFEEDFEKYKLEKLNIIKRLTRIYNIDFKTILEIFEERGYDYSLIEEIDDLITSTLSDSLFKDKLEEIDEGLFEILESESGNNIINV